MHELAVAFNRLCCLRCINYVIAATPFVHQDRILPHHVLIYVTKGHIKVIEDHVFYTVGEHQLFFLKAGVHHWGIEEIPAGTEWFFVHFYLSDPEPEARVFDAHACYMKNQEFSPEDYHYQVLLPKYLAMEKTNPVKSELENLLKLYRSDSVYRALESSQLLMRLLLNLYEISTESTVPDKQDILVRKLIHFLQAHLAQAVSSEQIALHMGMNYKYLCEVFKKKTGMTIHLYHTRLRITESARLLRESTMNISQAAQRVGYQDPLYYSNVFKRMTGVSPSEYLKQSYRGVTGTP